MKRIFQHCILLAVAVFLGTTAPSFAQSDAPVAGEAIQPAATEDVRSVLREAVEVKDNIVAVDIRLTGENLLEVKITGFMKRERPRIKNVFLVGPGVGRLGPITRHDVLAGLEKDPPYSTRYHGLLDIGKGGKDTPEGTLARVAAQHELPIEKMREKIQKKKKAAYEYWVYMESATLGGTILRYKFSLDELPKLILEKTE
ncbi:MAG: hypothetical protein ABH845_05160 [Candidatus Omnitrophota bacterium]